jgi:hypothetical protein
MGFVHGNGVLLCMRRPDDIAQMPPCMQYSIPHTLRALASTTAARPSGSNLIDCRFLVGDLLQRLGHHNNHTGWTNYCIYTTKK